MQFPLPCKKGWSRLGSSAITDEKVENANGIPRKTLLEEINQFLEHMGWPTWKAQMNLYKDWFIPEVLKVSGADSAKGRPWSLCTRDGFAPRGNAENPRNQEQRLLEMTEKMRTFLEK